MLPIIVILTVVIVCRSNIFDRRAWTQEEIRERVGLLFV